MIRLPLRLAIIAAFVSCASERPRTVGDELSTGNVTSQTVLDLARNSHLKGCVDANNAFGPKPRQSVFDICKKLSKEHESEIRYIIEQVPTPYAP